MSLKVRTEGKAILDGKKVVPCDDLIEWAEWFSKHDTRVANTEINGARVSTVFLGLDHGDMGWKPSGKSLWFETMIFGGASDNYCERYETWDEAEKRHNEIVASIMAHDGVL